jgi:hypothetical protein
MEKVVSRLIVNLVSKCIVMMYFDFAANAA